jgi:hypothetical protein
MQSDASHDALTGRGAGRMTQPLYLVELNEINFEYVQRYSAAGHLPYLTTLIHRHGLSTTVSESIYEHVEPWIQWVSAHTGKSFDQHKIFRLGDIVDSNVEQIWEVLERRGVSVGAVSPMNAVNRLANPSFFVPDPWTLSRVSADGATQALYQAVRQAVSDNASSRLTPSSVLGLLAGFMRHVPLPRWHKYMSLAAGALKRPWLKAIFLDELLADLFLSLLRRHSPQFATVFLNAGAHIQHHYLFSSAAYRGGRKNPKWYVPDGRDPVLEVYNSYDAFIGRLVKHRAGARVVIATGLRQVPYPHETYYWRLKNHDQFLRRANVPFKSVEALMSRDFILQCGSAQDAARAADLLAKVRLENDARVVFEIDNRGMSLFCTLVFDGDIEPGRVISVNGRQREFRSEVSFVALKNAHHNGLGYLIDTAKSTGQQHVPLTSLFSCVSQHFGLDSPA